MDLSLAPRRREYPVASPDKVIVVKALTDTRGRTRRMYISLPRLTIAEKENGNGRQVQEG